ncbi:type 1 fimbrial major subunit FimA [Serratia fonticola]
MKHTLISSALLATLFLSGAANATYGGRINFEGQLVNAACAVDANSVDQTIQMGQFRTASFGTAGSVTLGTTTSKVPFSIQLNDCDTTVAQTAAVGFVGSSTPGTPTALAIGSGAGTANGVGIRITDSAGVAAPLDGTVTTPVTLVDGKNVLPFHAQYIATATTVTAGIANAPVTFQVTYP